jgi:dihydropyrimidinase
VEKDLLIQNGTVVTESDVSACDVLCSHGVIKKIAPHIDIREVPGAEIIDAAGNIVLPGGVDVHTHLNLDVGIAVSSDDFYTGTVAAAFGGTTTIVDHLAFGPSGCALDHQIKKYHGFAGGKAIIDYGFHGVIQHVDDDVLVKMAALINEGITSYKIYTIYDYKVSDGEAYRVLKRAKELGLVICVHPENHEVIQYLRSRFVSDGKTAAFYHPLSRPAECEAEAVNRMILIAEAAGREAADTEVVTGAAPLYIVHLSNALALSFIKAAQERGQRNLYAETCPQYLLLDDSLYGSSGGDPTYEGLKYIMCPPLRQKNDQAALWKALAGNNVNTVATDHCPFFFATQKMQGKNDFTKCPSGAPGLEERMPLLFSEGVMKGRLSLRRFVEITAANPARIFGMYPQKGVICEGSDADIVIFNPEKKVTLTNKSLHGNVDYSAYEGTEVTGYPEYTISRGEIIVSGGMLHANAGRGKFITRRTLSAYHA